MKLFAEVAMTQRIVCREISLWLTQRHLFIFCCLLRMQPPYLNNGTTLAYMYHVSLWIRHVTFQSQNYDRS